MKRLLITLTIAAGLIVTTGCGGDGSGGAPGEEADPALAQAETQETPAVTEGEHTHNGETAEGHTHGDGQTDRQAAVVQGEGSGAVTHWTDKTELFMEYPEIVVGREATFAVHLTRLSDFAPLSSSTVTFALESPEGARLSVTETEVQVPGIYGPDFTFEQAGRYDLTITIAGMVRDTLRVNGIPVYNSADDIPQPGEEEDPGLITFLKEQQWKVPFGTGRVSRRALTQTIEAAGEIAAAQNSQAVVTAPFSGMILSSRNRDLPVEGEKLRQGTSMVVLNPAIQSGGGDNYAQQFINARSELELATSNLERSRRLYEKEAIPETELQKARIAYRQALTRYQTVSEVIQVDTAAIEGYGDSAESYRFELKAPIDGTIVQSHVTPGMQVEAGQPLYRMADASRIWLKAYVPASRRNEIGNAGEAAFRVQGDDRLYEVSALGGRLISRSNSVDPKSRTLSLVYQLSNTPEKLPLGMFTTVYIDTETKEQALAIPESALVEEEGTYSVYVHVSGESFEKRRITTGIRDRGWVEVTSGLEEGEHVVTKNAYQITLASKSSETPEHGHSH